MMNENNIQSQQSKKKKTEIKEAETLLRGFVKCLSTSGNSGVVGWGDSPQ